MRFSVFLIFMLAVQAVSSCKKDKEEPTPPSTGTSDSGKVYIHLDSKWEGSNDPFVLNNAYIQTNSGDELTFATYKYYISNFKLKKTDGTWWSHPDSYFLVDAEIAGSDVLQISGVPIGNFTDISFVMGVDSTKNVSGPQAGALSTANGMFWSWNSGYIMLKAEGTSPQVASGNVFSYHLGGFEGTHNIVKKLDYNFGSTNLSVSKTGSPQVHMRLDVSKLFDGVGTVANGSTTSPGNLAFSMATSFHNGIIFDYLVN